MDTRNPSIVFGDYLDGDTEKEFKAALWPDEEKYESYLSNLRDLIENDPRGIFSIQQVRLPNPNNPADILDGVLLSYEV